MTLGFVKKQKNNLTKQTARLPVIAFHAFS